MEICKFKCLRCNFRWPEKPNPTQCPKCYNLYVKWENYEEMRKYWDVNEKNENKE